MGNNSEKINWDLITQDKAEFILSQSEKCLESSLQNTDSIDRKTFIILAGLFSFISAMIPLILTRDMDTASLLVIVFMLFGFTISSSLCLSSLNTKTIYLIGNTPKNLLHPKYSGYDYLYLLQCELQSNDNKILKATEVNALKGDKVNKAIKCVRITLFISTLTVPIALFYRAQEAAELAGGVGASALLSQSLSESNTAPAYKSRN